MNQPGETFMDNSANHSSKPDGHTFLRWDFTNYSAAMLSTQASIVVRSLVSMYTLVFQCNYGLM